MSFRLQILHIALHYCKICTPSMPTGTDPDVLLFTLLIVFGKDALLLL